MRKEGRAKCELGELWSARSVVSGKHSKPGQSLRSQGQPVALYLCVPFGFIHCVHNKRPPFYFSNNSVKN